MTDVVDEFLEHYGKKGMKWGQRKAGKQKLGSSKDFKRASSALSKAKTSGAKSLSNKELRDLNDRLGLEQRYKQLNPSTAAKGKTFLGKFLGTPAKGIAVGIATQQVSRVVATKIAAKAAAKTVHYVVAP